MEYVKDTELKRIQTSHPDILKGRKDVAYVRYSQSGKKIHTVYAVTISCEQGYFAVGK